MHTSTHAWRRCVVEVHAVFQLRKDYASVFLDLCADDIAHDSISFDKFDANRAQCYEVKDRDHLLSIIESSFGRRVHSTL